MRFFLMNVIQNLSEAEDKLTSFEGFLKHEDSQDGCSNHELITL